LSATELHVIEEEEMTNNVMDVVTNFLLELEKPHEGTVAELGACCSDDVQHIDEISKKWSRGRERFTDYLHAALSSVSSIKSHLTDVSITTSQDIAIVTCVLHQSYTLAGDEMSIIAPTTFVLRSEDDSWKILVMHSVPTS
jgi:ketosteroid isomerase-like protein